MYKDRDAHFTQQLGKSYETMREVITIAMTDEFSELSQQNLLNSHHDFFFLNYLG